MTKLAAYISLSALSLAVIMFAILWDSDDTTFYIRQSHNEKFGVNYNAVRKKLGIPEIPKNWYTRETSLVPTGFIRSRRAIPNYWKKQIWKDFDVHIKTPYHAEKEIHRFTKDIDMEIDRFKSQINDSVQHLLEIRYSYLRYNDNWEAALMITKDLKDDYLVESIDLSKSQADSLLRLWGLSYNN